MRFCPSCGRPLPEGLVIHCPSCGATIPAAMNEAERLGRDAEQVAGDAAATAKSLGDQFEAISRDPLAPTPEAPPAVEPPDMTYVQSAPQAAPLPPVAPVWPTTPQPPQRPRRSEFDRPVRSDSR